MQNIIDIHARQLLDSRGNPTLEVELYTEQFMGSAAVPSGASTGVHEAVELRDGGKEYGGKAVTQAVTNVNTKIRDALRDKNVLDQTEVDSQLLALDGTPNKKNLGANATLGVSLAASRAAAAANEATLYEYLAALFENKKLTLPIPFANVINGGVHAGNKLMPQEFMIVPTGARSYQEAVRMVAETYHELKNVIADTYGKDATNVGDEGGFAPPLASAEEALDLLMKTITRLGYEKKITFAMDPAASEFYDAKEKTYEVISGEHITGKELAKYWLKLLKNYPIVSLEDPFAEDDYEHWAALTQTISEIKPGEFAAGVRPQIVGDDLTVSNPDRIAMAIEKKLCNALLLKVNQIGTLSEAMAAAGNAIDAGWNVMVSHRSGETEDPYIADLAVGLGCGQIKLGAPCRSDRTAKYNQLLRISDDVDTFATFSSPKN